MAEKEATVFLIDVGPSMGDKHHGRDSSDLDWAMEYVWDKISAIVATGRKTLCAGVVAFRTDETKNILQADEGYNNINALKVIEQITMPSIRNLREQIKPSRTKRGDGISAIVVASQMLSEFCRKLKYKRKAIVMVTNGEGAMELDPDSASQIASKLKEDGVELVVLGADFDDPDYGFKEDDKSNMKRENEVALKELTEQANGVFGTLKQAIDELGTPRVKTVKPVPTYRGKLRLGNPEEYESAMEIDVERYPRTMVAMAPTATRYNIKSEGDAMDVDGGAGVDPDEKDAGIVHQMRTYEVKDESAPGGKREVERDELAKGYSYGNTAVHIEQSDENVTKLETVAGLDLIGFIPKDNHEHYMNMSRASVILAHRTNDLAAMALSSFIHTLWELDSYAIARLVSKEWRPPSMILLAPSIEADLECLIEVELPFAEDFRQHKFPPLDRIITLSGKVHTEHRNLPTKELKEAMAGFVDSMDLSAAGDEDDEGKPTEYLPPSDTFSPKLHRLQQAIRHRAVHPDSPVPPPLDSLTRFSRPPDQVLAAAAPQIDALAAAATIKKVPPRAKSRGGRYRNRDRDQPKSGLDVRALLTSARPAPPPGSSPRAIDPANAIPEFKQLFDAAGDEDDLARAVAQLSSVVRSWVADSLGDAAHGRAIEAVRAMRSECAELEVAGLYNRFLEELKADVFAGRLGGDRREFWHALRLAHVAPIVKQADERSAYDEGAAREFMLPVRAAKADES